MKNYYDSSKKRVVVRIAGALISIAIALVSAGVTCIVTGATEQAKINNQCFVSYTSTFNFAKANGQQFEVTRIQPCKGKLQVQLCQTSGKNGTQYVVYVKKANEYAYKKVKAFSCKNKTATSYVNLAAPTNNSTKYDVKVVKTTNFGTASKLNVKYILK